jgi:uncharacterized protein YceK
MLAKNWFTVIGMTCLLATAGCGTTYNFSGNPEGPSIYGGVAYDLSLLDPSGSCKGLGVVFGPLDLPFSLVLDTATLPVTALCELFGGKRTREQRLEDDAFPRHP